MGKQVSNAITVFGLANGMIGGTILVLPILSLAAGYIISPLLIIVMGSISLYTAYLIIVHLGKEKNIKESILAHFDQDYRYMVSYCIIIWISQIPLLILYFKLISLQLQGLFGCCENFIGPSILLFLVFQIIIVRIYQIGEQTMAFGIISIITYIVFLFWAQFSAPQGQRQVPQFGNPYSLASALLMAFTVHDFIVQNIIKNPNRLEYVKMVVQTFIIGIATYMFIAFGSYAIVNRKAFKQNPQTIQDYFQNKDWQVIAIQMLYLVHLITVFPIFLFVSKSRFYQILRIEEHSSLSWSQGLYLTTIITVCFLFLMSGMPIQILISINGAILGFFIVLAIPIFIHIKCVFFNKSSGFIEGEYEHNESVSLNSCECEVKYISKWTLYLQTLFLFFIIILGILLVFFTLDDLIRTSDK